MAIAALCRQELAFLWYWSLSPVRFVQDIGPGNQPFAKFVNMLWTFGALCCRFESTCNTLEFEPFIFDGCFETHVGLQFMVGFGLIEAWCGVYLTLI